MKNLISVVIPVYNSEKTLTRCVESIIYGQYSNVEVLLIEDQSTDNSWNVCKELQKKYLNVKCYQNSVNSGVSATRNNGIAMAAGDYIVFVDSDDWVSKNYVAHLYEKATEYPDSLVTCGMCFINERDGYRHNYIWEENGSQMILISKEDFFDLIEKFYIQSPFNKIFSKKIIEENNLLFDETQSMGEDFQFVLDYMEALQCERCIILNEVLYYYIRYTNNSLMRNFGLVEQENEFRRLKQLLRIIGEDNTSVKQRYFHQIQASKDTYVYHICHNKQLTKKQKLEYLENLLGVENAYSAYKRQQKVIVREEIARIYHRYPSKIKNAISSRIQRRKNRKTINKMRNDFEIKDVTIICQNCIGGVFYHDMESPFLSPTINLYFKCRDFVKFALNLEYYMSQKVQMKWDEEYPLGILDDVEIHFMHYNTCTEAKEAWERRKERINWKKIIVLSTDMEDFTDDVYEQWKRITYPKVLFTAVNRKGEGVVFYPEYEKYKKVPDLIPKREFYKNGVLVNTLNKITD